MGKKIYGAAVSGKVIAAHESIEAVESFCAKLEHDKKITADIVKLKHAKKQDLTDVYLVRYGETYIPYHYYDILKEQDEQLVYDLRYAKDVLLRVLEDDNTGIPRKHINKVIMFLEEQLDYSESEIPNLCTLDSMIHMRDEYERKMGTD